MAKSNNTSVLGLSLVFLFSIFLFLQMAQTESRRLSGSSDGSGNAKAAELSCFNVIGHKEGETCFSITQQFNLTMDEFIFINPNLNCNKLFVGQWLCLAAVINGN